MATEADTCRTLITPKLRVSGWETDPHSIAEQRFFTDGRIVVHGNKALRRKGKRADHILRYARDFAIAVVEAKPEPAATGLQQAKDYAEILQLKFAYSTNGLHIIEFDYITGLERELNAFPTPAELWSRLRAAEKLTDETAARWLLVPVNLITGKEPRYYQQIAIDGAVQAILQGKRRALLTLAPGTGKTVIAFQICWKLWSSKWNAKSDPTRKPRILYLADRNFLIDDPKDKIFAPFGDARHKIEGGVVVFSRELYFATYQSIAKDERRPGLYKEFAPDFFDFIIVDECHRGSAKEESNWRDILASTEERAGVRSRFPDEVSDGRKYYFDGGQVEIAADLAYELDADGKQLRVVKLTDYTGDKVRSICPSTVELRARWSDPEQRAQILEQLGERGIDFQTLASLAGKPDADPFDLLCHLAFNAPVLTRRQRADRLKKQQAAFFGYFAPDAREILNDLLEKYATDGELQFTLPDVLKVPPISQRGNVAEIIGKFGGADQLRNAVNKQQSLLYAA
ncbi:MAG: DEAD/DEAH box helicase family protein [Verrucomicrobiales bacterium]|nr:DEAD/DEAH box helicase family protein [Verrucomicrobiales bacterium]